MDVLSGAEPGDVGALRSGSSDLYEHVGLTGSAPDTTLIWTGAGVSMDPPSSLPSGAALAHRVLHAFFSTGTAERIAAYYTLLRVPERPTPEPIIEDDPRRARSVPRLEAALLHAWHVHGDDVFSVLGGFRAVPPNRLHYFFAQHLHAGGHHLTANFDDLIERAAKELGYGSPVVDHFHGALRSDRDYGRLGVLLDRIEPGFSQEVRDRIARQLQGHRLVVVLGYGGVDFFDVDPFLQSLPAGSLSGVRVVWVDHTDVDPRIVAPADEFPQVGWLRDAGATAVQLEGRSADACSYLCDRWGFDPLRPVVPSKPPSWAPPAVTSIARDRATFEIFRAMGAVHEVRRLLPSVQPVLTEAELAGVNSELAWLEGRYRDARRSWRRVAPVSAEAALHRRERTVATLWAQGRRLPAFALGTVAVASTRRRYDPGDPVLSSEPYIALVEDLARITGHARRSPDTRLLVPLLRRIAAHYLVTTSKVDSSQLRARLVDAASTIGVELPEAGGVPDVPELVFQEAESLTGVLQYRHGAYRARWQGPLGEGEATALVRAYRELYGHRQVIGALGDGARMVTGLPHARLAFGAAEFRRSLATLQLAPMEHWRSRLFRALPR
ncbi:MAG: SIR2 family protein [Acidimicrobiales bacterium]